VGKREDGDMGTEGKDAAIRVVDVREGGPVEHARLSRDAMLALKRECFSVVPAPARGVAAPLDAVSRSWLRRSPSPYVGEIARISDIAGEPGVWFVNASYEWGCTTRVDGGDVPTLRRTLDWPLPGLGRRVEVALQDGGAGIYANVTWPGAVGVLTAVAPGRFAAAINQAPLYRRSAHPALKPVDMGLNALRTWGDRKGWPAAHLLRRAFDACPTYDAAVDLLCTTPVARPTLFSVAGTERGQSCLIERTQDAFSLMPGTVTIANDWHPGGERRQGRWTPRGRHVGGVPDCEERRGLLERHAGLEPFGWVAEPVLGPLTRLAVEAIPGTGELRVLGYEAGPEKGGSAEPVTGVLTGRVDATGFHTE
jgi:hypothetical protein